MSREIWEKNLSAMETWYPSFSALLREKEADGEKSRDGVEILKETSWDGEVIFRVQKGERQLYLGGKRNAKAPVSMWMQRLGTIQKQAPVFLLGIGSGAYVKALVQNTEKDVNVLVYEPSLHLFLTALREIDLSEEIENRPIAFIVKGINDSEFEPVMNKILVFENLEFMKEEVHPNYKELFADELVEKLKLLRKKTESMLVNYNTGILFSKNIVQNLFNNMKYVCQGFHTKKLSEVIPYDGPAILIAAGPSLNKNIQELKKAKNKAFLLAVDTALKPLLKAGIVPDAFITIDANKLLNLVEMEGVEQIPVIAPPCAVYTILKKQKAPKIFYNDGYVLSNHIYAMNQKEFPNVATGGSVACSGFSLLYKMGFDTIILVGQDLAYTGNKSHADGTFREEMPEENTRNMFMVKGNYEDMVPTRRDFRIFLEWFNMYIEGAKKYRNIRVVNATEGGAYIEGTELMTLKDIIAEVCHEEIDFSLKIQQMQSAFTQEERKKAVEYLHGIPGEFDEVIKTAKLLKKAYQKIEKIGNSGNIEKDNVSKQLKKVKKLTKQCREKEVFQLIETTMVLSEYIIRSEFYYEGDSLEEELRESARKGIRYSELLMECAGFLKELAEETLLPISETEDENDRMQIAADCLERTAP